jgi:hypothetical protein
MLNKFTRVALALLISACGSLFANVTAIEQAGGTITVKSKGTVTVQMARETVEIAFKSSTYTVTGTYYLLNTGKAATLEIGFPEWMGALASGEKESRVFSGFAFGVNGKPAKHDVIEIKANPKLENQVLTWYTTKVSFPAKKETVMTVSYECGYAQDGPFSAVAYLFGTGRTWFGKIAEMKYRLVMPEKPVWISAVVTRTDKKSTNRSFITGYPDPGTIELTFSDVEPGENEYLWIDFGAKPFWEQYFWHLGGTVETREFSPAEALKPDEVKFLNGSQLALLKDFFRAEAGFVFTDAELTGYFSSFKWYKPDPAVSEEMVSARWKRSLDLIAAIERSRQAAGQ